MGKIKTDMEELVNEIRSSVAARHAGVKDLRDLAHGLLTQDRGERQRRARTLGTQAHALGTKLARQGRDRLKAARVAKNNRGRVAAGRKAAVRANHSRMSSHLNHLRLERNEMAGQFRQSVQEEVAGIRVAAGALRSGVQAMMDGIGADVAEATRLWRTGPTHLK